MRDRHPDGLLSAFLDDELPETQAVEVAQHVAECAACLEDLQALREARSALRGLPLLQPPASLFESVPEAAAHRRRRHAQQQVLAGAGSLVVGVLALAFLVGGESPGDVVPPVHVVVVDHVARTGGGPMIQPVTFGR